ncbi:MAG: dTMP kinase [Thermoplasmata archaeon]|nr:MAG: dTMP kinase [Thermoplasmata archaeon]
MMFIVIEGIDGSGKTTIAKKLHEWLRSRGYEVFLTAEPTQGIIGRMLPSDSLSEFAETFLFIADRAEHTKIIRDKLSKGYAVVCDRYYYSTCAYQAVYLAKYFGGDEKTIDYLLKVQKPIIIKPTHAFLLDIEPEEGLRRIEPRGKRVKFEKIHFLSVVRKNYLYIAEIEGLIVVDASQPIDDVFRSIIAHISE